VAGVVQTSVG